MRAFLPVVASSVFRSSSTFAPPLPITMPGLAAWIVMPTWFADRSISTQTRAGIGKYIRDDEIIRIEIEVVLGVRGSGLDSFQKDCRCPLRHEPQHRHRLGEPLAFDGCTNQSDLPRRHAHVLGHGS